MVGLYEYDTASYEECVEDLSETLSSICDLCDSDYFYNELDALERKGIRIQNIAQRLKELEEE